ncbi:MAG: cobalamin-binding protein [Gemmatimonadales bacterium]
MFEASREAVKHARVVSLLPAATEIVAALGSRSWLVGVSHECDHPPEVRTLPRVTRTPLDPALPSGAIHRAVTEARDGGVPPVTVDPDAVGRLAPDLVITQATCDVCAVDLAAQQVTAFLAALPSPPEVVTLHAHTLEGIFADIGRVGTALGLADEADELVAGMRTRMARVRDGAAPRASRPRVLLLEWLDPPYVGGHWVPELIGISGGVDVAARPGERSRAVAWRDLRARGPDVVIVAPCGFDAPRARREFAAVRDPDAAALFRTARVEFLDGNAYTSRPGPRLADAAEQLAALIRG